MISLIRLSLMGCAAGLLACGCVSAPYSSTRATHAVVEGYTDVSYNVSHPHVFIARIVSIDGKTVGSGKAPVALTPGEHHLLVFCDYRWTNAVSYDAHRDFILNAKAGHRYLLRPVVDSRRGTCDIAVSDGPAP